MAVIWHTSEEICEYLRNHQIIEILDSVGLPQIRQINVE